ncbi:MAG: DUF3078 domain-containing protein [Terrimonas ferruginea]|uniref:DUF3078 domain-containing protein n=1 Tax=Terrimonas ferruginea TaxID=249 RepID=UPI0009290CBE|nr:DUF3078 domain-containing protein [Terrimonas ferruginea]MBN8785055.1 DUF3078 domain-containing protein [Terrimonas ferruginea]OJW43341.1 MAG: hypothetical protein BGO56_06800 [Sphingobacteriales bacterium 48-107]
MKKTLLLFLASILFTSAFAQDQRVKALKSEAERTVKKDPSDTAQKKWKYGGQYAINVSQGSLNNWAAGGDEFSLSVNSVLNLFAFYKKGKHSWDNTLDFNLGYVNTTSLGSRKNDDRIDLLSKYGYALNPKLNLAGLFNFRSQFFKGYAYEDTARSLTSDLLSPAYVLLSAGLDYKPIEGLSIFVSPATSRWVFVMDDTLSAKGLYGVDSGRHSTYELGAFASINYMKEFNKIVSYKGRLDLFSNYRNKPGNIDFYFTNVVNIKLTRILSATYSLDLIYDDDVRLFGKNGTSPGLQLKSLIGLGLLLRF